MPDEFGEQGHAVFRAAHAKGDGPTVDGNACRKGQHKGHSKGNGCKQRQCIPMAQKSSFKSIKEGHNQIYENKLLTQINAD